MLDTHRFLFLLLYDDLDGERKGRKGSQGGCRSGGCRSGCRCCCFIWRSRRGTQLGRRSRTTFGRVNPYKCILKSSPTCHKKTSSVLFFDISFIRHLFHWNPLSTFVSFHSERIVVTLLHLQSTTLGLPSALTLPSIHIQFQRNND